MKGKTFLIVCVLFFGFFVAGIYVGSMIAQAHARDAIAVAEAKAQAWRVEVRQMREEYLKMAAKLEEK